jgi:hypothetical protein
VPGKTTRKKGGFSFLPKSDTLIRLEILPRITTLTCLLDNLQERRASTK